LAAFLLTTKPEKSITDNITATGFFQRRSKPVEKRLFTQTKPMCELVEGIVTVPQLLDRAAGVFNVRGKSHQRITSLSTIAITASGIKAAKNSTPSYIFFP
jgi:hypothetical protein